MFTEERSLTLSGRLFVAALFVLSLAACKGGPVTTSQTMADAIPASTAGADNASDQSAAPDPRNPERLQSDTTPSPALSDPSTPEPTPDPPTRHSGKPSGNTARTLSWTAPATREDGSKLYLSEIKEYRIHYRLRHQEKFRIIRINDPSRTSYPLAGFKPGAYEFAITTIDMSDMESRPSGMVVVDLF